ncbi:hypothetical protein B0O99DRAFT_611836 [Bisporella sp. PMI_857]|nr:hypothetical protein B0O99DRAFT_611836 [Bisporella sp. PMI_857]
MHRKLTLHILSAIPKSLGTTTRLPNIVFNHPFAFPGKLAWLKRAIFNERLTIIHYFFNNTVWIHFIIPLADVLAVHSPSGVAYDHYTTTPSIILLRSRLVTELAPNNISSGILTASAYLNPRCLNSACERLVLASSCIFRPRTSITRPTSEVVFFR